MLDKSKITVAQRISNLPSISKLIQNNNIKADKRLGQNYIVDHTFTDHMVKAAGDTSNSVIIEIGPGLGSLTRSILSISNARKIIAIEKDQQFLPILDQLAKLSNNRVNIINADAMIIDEIDLIDNQFKNNLSDVGLIPPYSVEIIANLPYNIATALIYKWLKIIFKHSLSDNFRISGITVMLQKEVADRITAPTRSKSYGYLSVLSQWLCSSSQLFDVPAEAFWPQPKVVSTVVHLSPYQLATKKFGIKQLEHICSISFSQRRKTIKSTLGKCLDNSSEAFNKLGIDPSKRPEELSVDDFINIAEFYSTASNMHNTQK